MLQLCPSLAKILINTYRNDVNMFISNETLFSSEGTTQGDPLAMAMYAISTIPLIMMKLKYGMRSFPPVLF